MSSLRTSLILGILVGCFVWAPPAHAQSLSFSITPTMFEMAAEPGQAWKTSIKVINNNDYPLTVYATPVNFEPEGEYGHGVFLPVFGSLTDGRTLAEWMTVPTTPLTIPPESSASVPVQLSVPTDAAPGGHYAAVMVGTRPPEGEDRLQVKTSQLITSLFFVTVAGDVVEQGEVRTFRTEHALATTPEMAFEVRFENKGNVHLLPRGEIVITNMWGRERGRIPINRETHFGNVLPESIRQFEFSWKGEQSFADIGRYKAVLTLGYGSSEQRFVTRSAIFWVVPVKPLLITLTVLVFAVWFITRSVRAYVRYMLKLSGIDPDSAATTNGGSRYVPRAGDVRIERSAQSTPSVREPIRRGILDLKRRLEQVHAFKDTLVTLLDFVKSYRIFFVSILVAVAIVALVWHYLGSVMSDARDYEVTIENPGNPVVLSSEEIMHVPEVEPVASSTEQTYILTLVNSSDTPGLAGQLADELVRVGYRVDDLQSDFDAAKQRSVIVYSQPLADEALALSQVLDGALLSAYTSEDTVDALRITVFIGNDYRPPVE